MIDPNNLPDQAGATPAATEKATHARVYIAARFSRRPECNALGHVLKAKGGIITSRWIKPDADHVLPTGLSRQAEDSERQRFALEDVEDVRAANWTISLMEEPRSNTRGGRHIEFGLALALGHRLTIIGPRETVFHHLPNVEHFASVDEFVASLPDRLVSTPDTRSADVPVDDDSRDFADSILPEAMIEAGVAAYERAQTDMLNYVSGQTIDWDAGMIAVAIYRAMTAAAPKSQPPQTADTDAMREAGERIVEKIGSGEFYADGDKFDVVFRPGGGCYAGTDQIVLRGACGDSAYWLPGLVAKLLNAALSPTHTVSDMGIREAAQFLSDRLDDLEWHDGDLESACREYMGHVEPAHARLKASLTADKPDTQGLYLVWSNEHQAWWGKDRCGYTRHIERAGRYDRAEALKIAGTRDGGWHVRKGNPDEIAIPERDAVDQYAAITEALNQESR